MSALFALLFSASAALLGYPHDHDAPPSPDDMCAPVMASYAPEFEDEDEDAASPRMTAERMTAKFVAAMEKSFQEWQNHPKDPMEVCLLDLCVHCGAGENSVSCSISTSGWGCEGGCIYKPPGCDGSCVPL